MINGQYLNCVRNRHLLAAASCLLAMLFCMPAHAQFGRFFGGNGVVGGVSIDANGTLRSATMQEKGGLLKDMRNSVGQPSADMAKQANLRMISLGGIQAEVAKAIAEGTTLSEEVRYLAGLQRIEYVFVYPEKNDIVLAGPAEGWVVREDASVVGETTGRPVIHLEDLITALRASKQTQSKAMSVSIDPTPEGAVALRNLLSRISGNNFNPAQAEPMIKEAFGAQVVSLTAVPEDSRMASTLVAADYQMKRIAMSLDASPVRGLPSYMDMIRNSGASATQPRWWMACDYDAILHSEDKLAWRLSGKGIKALTESEVVEQNGQRTQTGKANKTAQKWADLFTAKLDELCQKNSAFGDLRNVMDLNIVAAVIAGHQLERVAGCDLGLLRGTEGDLKTPSYRAPKNIDPQCSFVRGRVGWTISASGGVEINPWKVVGTQSKEDSAVHAVYTKARKTGASWWWN
ncbi:MAG: DUF1598 domain-containing protein [Planctomycetota bacterium]